MERQALMTIHILVMESVLVQKCFKNKQTTIQPEAELKTNCWKKCCFLSIHYNFITDIGEEIGYVYINGLKQYEFKTKKVKF